MLLLESVLLYETKECEKQKHLSERVKHLYLNFDFSSTVKFPSPEDVGIFAEPRKLLCMCVYICVCAISVI